MAYFITNLESSKEDDEERDSDSVLHFITISTQS
jgi:hypothetical protein